jgi:galactokinase
VECAVICGLNELFQLEIGKLEMMKMAQKAEHEYAGVRCGIMDQFASVFGKKDHVIQLDCKSLHFAYKPLVMEGFKIILFDTQVKHSLANSEYNIRRKQCETGVSIIHEHIPSVKSLRDVTIQQLEEYVMPEDSAVFNKCKYVVEENRRLLAACDDLEKGDIRSFGKRMFQTHEGLSTLYEVSCTELDFLVDIVKINPFVLGARMMGGGFGGCTINLIAADSLEEVIQTVSDQYKERFGNIPGVHIINIDNGSTILQQLN